MNRLFGIMLAGLVSFLLTSASFAAECQTYDTLPVWVPHDTLDAELPCFEGTPTPEPGAVLLYDGYGRARWLLPDGRLANVGDDVLVLTGHDSTVISARAESAGVSKGEFVIGKQVAQLMVLRALRLWDLW